MKATLDVRGMSCGHCKMTVEGALSELNGVSNVDVDLAGGNVEVTYDETQITLDSIRDAVEEQGYDVVA